MAKMIGLSAIDLDHVLGHRALGREAEEDVGALQRFVQRPRRWSSTACADFHWFMPSVRP